MTGSRGDEPGDKIGVSQSPAERRFKVDTLSAVFNALVARPNLLLGTRAVGMMFLRAFGWIVTVSAPTREYRVVDVAGGGEIHINPHPGMQQTAENRRITSFYREVKKKQVHLHRVVEGSWHGADLVLMRKSGPVVVEIKGPLGIPTLRDRMARAYIEMRTQFAVYLARQTRTGRWDLYRLGEDGELRLAELGELDAKN
jgi:hypothetical protein